MSTSASMVQGKVWQGWGRGLGSYLINQCDGYSKEKCNSSNAWREVRAGGGEEVKWIMTAEFLSRRSMKKYFLTYSRLHRGNCSQPQILSRGNLNFCICCILLAAIAWSWGCGGGSAGVGVGGSINVNRCEWSHTFSSSKYICTWH